MSKADLFLEQNKIGSNIIIFLSGGREISGKIEAITNDCVVLSNGNNNSTFFFEMIGGWGSATSQVALEGSQGSTEKHNDRDVNPTILDSSIFELAILKSKPTIGLPEVNFRVENLVTDDNQELVRAKNKYEYAVKIKELSRLHDIIPPLVRLAERVGNSSLFCLCGILKLKLGALAEAEDFLDKSLTEPIPNAFLAYAYIESVRDNWTKCANNLLSLSADSVK